MARRFLYVSVIALTLASCSEPEQKSPIPPDHPADRFFAVARRGPTDANFCRECGGEPMSPQDFVEPTEQLATGVFRGRLKTTNREYLFVTYGGERGVLVAVGACGWPEEGSE